MNSAGNRRMAPNIFTRNMKVNSMPMSAWNLSGEKIHVTTPIANVTPVKMTPDPVICSVSI
jgi:hypothetical protein